MSADMLMRAWGDTVLTTALLVLAILAIRKPFARHFGPGLTYALWLVPALRLILPPLPLAEPVATSPAIAAGGGTGTPFPAEIVAVPSIEPAWTLADAMPWLFIVWMTGMAAVLVMAMVSHQRFRAAVFAEAVELEPIGKVRLVMTDAVDGPVAFGVWRRFVAVPHDFFARYVAEERALAIDHELAHHRHGDLWANAAALILLASQWFNPFAWRAIRAFRFDQEAACDARVLTMADVDGRSARTARYATAIVKAAVGPRLSLAAPMAVHDNLQERLTMLTRQDISKQRGLVGRLLVSGSALAVLATTATLVPASVASARSQQTEIGEPAEPPAAPRMPDAPAVPEAPRPMIFTSAGERADKSGASIDGKKRGDHHIVIRSGDPADENRAARVPTPTARHYEFRIPGAVSREDIIATLKEQGVTGKRANAIADKLEATRVQRIALAQIPPVPPAPPRPPLPPVPSHALGAMQGKTMVFGRCGDKQAAPIVHHDETHGNKRSSITMFACSDAAESKAAGLLALKKAREAFAESRRVHGLSDAMRAKVAADIDKAIAEAEKSGH